MADPKVFRTWQTEDCAMNVNPPFRYDPHPELISGNQRQRQMLIEKYDTHSSHIARVGVMTDFGLRFAG
jgi:hypothetical protein